VSEPPQPLGQALRQRVGFGPVAVPIWSLLSITVVGAALAAQAWRLRQTEPAGAAVAASVPHPSSSIPQPAPAATAPEPGPVSVAARARAGELEALKLLDGAPAADRTIEDCVAIADGYAVRSRRSVEQLGRDLGQNPALLADPTSLALLFRHATDPVDAPAALAIVAALPGSIGPDMLYDVWKQSSHAATQSLAEDLLKARSVRDKASEPLELLLMLEAETRCERIPALLVKLRQLGDRRALPRLKQLARKTGCGEKRSDDCYECLRGDGLLRAVHEAAKQRKPPRPWAIRRR
jgi:hypothetical protein